jgi:hypothetical protein
MRKRELARRLFMLQPELVNIIGFYDLIENDTYKKTPLSLMTYQVHFTAAAMKVARELISMIDDLEEDFKE